MKKITNLTNDYKQKHLVTTEQNQVITLNLEYIEQQQGWFYNLSFSDGTKITNINGARITLHPNLLRQWQNILPFGLLCAANDGIEPFLIDDFLNERVELYLLDSDDVKYLESNVYKAG